MSDLALIQGLEAQVNAAFSAAENLAPIIDQHSVLEYLSTALGSYDQAGVDASMMLYAGILTRFPVVARLPGYALRGVKAVGGYARSALGRGRAFAGPALGAARSAVWGYLTAHVPWRRVAIGGTLGLGAVAAAIFACYSLTSQPSQPSVAAPTSTATPAPSTPAGPDLQATIDALQAQVAGLQASPSPAPPTPSPSPSPRPATPSPSPAPARAPGSPTPPPSPAPAVPTAAPPTAVPPSPTASGYVASPPATPVPPAATRGPTTATPVTPLGVLRDDYSLDRGYVRDGEAVYSRARTDYNFPDKARQVFCGLGSQIAGSAESTLVKDYPASVARDRAAALAQRVRDVCSGVQRMIGWVLYKPLLEIPRTGRTEERFMVGVEIGNATERGFFRSPLPDTLYSRLAADYGFPPDTLVPMRPCSPAPCR